MSSKCSVADIRRSGRNTCYSENALSAGFRCSDGRPSPRAFLGAAHAGRLPKPSKSAVARIPDLTSGMIPV
jgi:hypothetical protein